MSKGDRTFLEDLINPEVLAQMTREKLTDNMVFLPVVDLDDTLMGTPGDTIRFPVYGYIGDATVVGEGVQIPVAPLVTSYRDATVVKTGRGVIISDEAVLSGYGSPADEASVQLARALDNKADNDVYTEFKKLHGTRQLGIQGALGVDDVADALAIYGEDEDGLKAFYINAGDRAVLRKSDDYIKASELGQTMILKGTVGEIFGAQIIVSNKIKKDATSGERWLIISKPGAVKFIRKRNIYIEPDRVPGKKQTEYYGDYHYVAYLYDESKAVAIRQFSKVVTLTSVTSVVGTTAQNDTFLKIPDALLANTPVGYKWVYKLGSSDVTPTFGTALSNYVDYISAKTEIAASTSTKASVAMVDGADKPVFHQNVTLVKKS